MANEMDPDLKGVPRKLGRYVLRYKLASGGMAAVWLARASGSGTFEKVVAVKTIHPHMTGEASAVRMFMDEARIASAINHPNVCQVFDFGEQEGVHYLVMEYLFGEPLSRVTKKLAQLEDGAPRERLALLAARIIADAAEGLHAAHELKDDKGQLLEVVHRDVSPQNIFINYDGAVKVVDFGVARARARLEHTQSGGFKGKFEYSSPEQVAGKPFDRRADVWALGVTLWEAVTLKKLFRRDELAAVFSAIAFDDIPLASSVDPSVPAELDAIIATALQRDVTKRYPTARELGRALRQFMVSQGASIDAPEVGEWMSRLFAEDKAKRLALREAVSSSSADDELPMVPVPAEFTVNTGSKSLSRVRPEIDAQTPTPFEPPPRASRVPLLLAVVLLPLLGAGAAIAWLSQKTPPAAESAPTEPPRPPRPQLAAVTPPTPPPVLLPLVDAGTPEAEHAGAVLTPVDAGDGAPEPVDAGPPAALEPPDAGAPVPIDAGPPPVKGGKKPAPVAVAAAKKPRLPAPAPPPPPLVKPVEPPPPLTRSDPAKAGATGFVRVKSAEVVEVLVDGKVVGKTPQYLELPVGSHRLELRIPGTERGSVRMLNVQFASEYTVELE